MCVDVEEADGVRVDLFKYESPIAGDVDTALIFAIARELVIVEEGMVGVLAKQTETFLKCGKYFVIELENLFVETIALQDFHAVDFA